jgi:hypothetical protein
MTIANGINSSEFSHLPNFNRHRDLTIAAWSPLRFTQQTAFGGDFAHTPCRQGIAAEITELITLY